MPEYSVETDTISLALRNVGAAVHLHDAGMNTENIGKSGTKFRLSPTCCP